MYDTTVIRRNEEFLRNKNQKIASEIPTELKECTFTPRIKRIEGASKMNSVLAGDRLYKYHDIYETNKIMKRDSMNQNVNLLLNSNFKAQLHIQPSN